MARGRLEGLLENAFEGVFARAFRSRVSPMQLGRRLLQVADAEREIDAHGRRAVPNTYIIQVSAADREGLAEIEPAMLYELTEALRMHVRTEGYHVAGKARVALRTSPDLRRGRFEVTAKNVEQESASAEVPAVPAPVPETSTPEALGVQDAPHDAPLAPVVPLRMGTDLPPAVLTTHEGKHIELYEGHYVVGRHLECDIVITDTNVSRRHAEFVCAGSDVIVRDLGSTNGTKVNGVSITGDQLLVHGDVIRFGTAQMSFEAT